MVSYVSKEPLNRFDQQLILINTSSKCIERPGTYSRGIHDQAELYTQQTYINKTMTRYSSIIAIFLLSSTNNSRGSTTSSSQANAEGITFFDQDYNGGEVTYFTYGTPRKPGDDNKPPNNNDNNEVIDVPNEAVQTFITEYYNYGSRVDPVELAQSIEESITTTDEEATVAVAAKGGKEPPLDENGLLAGGEGVAEPEQIDETTEGGSPEVIGLEEGGSTAELYVGTSIFLQHGSLVVYFIAISAVFAIIDGGWFYIRQAQSYI